MSLSDCSVKLRNTSADKTTDAVKINVYSVLPEASSKFQTVQWGIFKKNYLILEIFQYYILILYTID